VTASGQADFDTFVAARAPALGRTAYPLTGDAHLAEDLVQTALFKAARVWHRIEGDPEPYVRRILYTQNVSWWRSRRHREVGLGRYDAPAAAPDPWTRARRSLVRDRIAGTVAAVALVAGGALVATAVLDHTQEAEPMLPSHYSASGDSALPVEDDLAVGPVALAYPLEIDGFVRAVVSTAGEGTHHALALPDLVSADAQLVWVGGQPLRLSPDGTELAYLTDNGGGDGGATGIDIVDLRTGAVRRSELPRSLATPKLTWSPSGTWLAWSGLPVSADGRSTGRHQVTGLIGPDGAAMELRIGDAEVAPADDGTVAVLPPGKPIRLWEDGRLGSSIDDGPAGHAETARLVHGVLSELRVVADPESDLGSRTLLMRHGDRAESAEVRLPWHSPPRCSAGRRTAGCC